MGKKSKTLLIISLALIFTSCGANHKPLNGEPVSGKKDSSASSAKHPLKESYSAFIDSIANNTIYWKDGSKMPLSSGKYKNVDVTKLSDKKYEEYLDNCDPEMMVAKGYPYLQPVTPPAKNSDPGRARNTGFLKKVYGKNEGEVRKRLKKVVWLRKNVNKIFMVNGENGAAAALQKISDELDKLPKEFLKYLDRPAGTFNWRKVAGTTRLSAHSFGIAIDINVDQSHYWRNARSDASGNYKFKNSIPYEIVEIFERHGWIWGGRWYHYDTMHFEYRPEVVVSNRF